MAVAKVILNGTTLIDTTDKTVAADKLLDGYTALKNDGTTVTGNITSGSATTPATTITANPTISVSASGLITASVSGSQSVTPSVSAGYVSSGTAGTVTVSGSNTSQLTVYNGEHHQPTPLGYSVDISLTYGTSTAYFLSCNIYEFVNGSLGEQIGTITSASGSTTVTVTSGEVAVDMHSNNSYMMLGSEYVTGGVSHDYDNYIDDGGNSHCRCTFFVTGDGTIEISGIDWED